MERCDVCLIRTNQESHDGHKEEDGDKLRLLFQSLTEKLPTPLSCNIAKET